MPDVHPQRSFSQTLSDFRENYPEISFMKTFCLLCVIFYHALKPFGVRGVYWQVFADMPSEFATSLIHTLAPFIIPAFMFGSGFLFAHAVYGKKRPAWDQIKRRAKRLLMPWFLVMFFWLVPTYVFFDVPAYQRPTGLSLLETYRNGVFGVFTDHLWFLLVLFWVTIFWSFLFPVIKRLDPVWGFVIAVSGALLFHILASDVLWFCVGQVGPHILYFYLGAMVYTYRTMFNNYLQRFYWVIVAGLLFTGIVFQQFYSVIVYFGWIASLFFCLTLYLVSTWFVQRFPGFLQNRVYRYFERNAFYLYLFHMPTSILLFRYFNAGTLLPENVILLTFFANIAITAVTVSFIKGFQRALFKRKSVSA